MRYLTACYTDRGRRKAVNQDSLLISRTDCHGQEAVFAVICDGMGGLEQGEVASAETVRSFERWFAEDFPELAKREDFEDELYDSWEELLQSVHREIQEYGRRHRIRIGTTATAMLMWEGEYYIAHVGDCRIYEIKDCLVQLTRDQVQAELNREEKKEPGRKAGENVLLQGVGASKMIRPAYYSGRITEDAMYLLCTDGFRHEVSGQELYQAFRPEDYEDEDSMREQGKKMVETVMDRGENDNISVILLRTAACKKEDGV